jgi:hypothetical protein
MQVSVQPDGRVVIDAAPDEAATLAGRPFGDLPATMNDLRDRIADAWYRAGCPPTTAAPRLSLWARIKDAARYAWRAS